MSVPQEMMARVSMIARISALALDIVVVCAHFDTNWRMKKADAIADREVAIASAYSVTGPPK